MRGKYNLPTQDPHKEQLLCARYYAKHFTEII